MRHILANVITYAIAALLFVGAGLFAWMRSSQLTITNERALLARFEPAPAHEFLWRELGESSYERNCANCHGPDGAGWDQYPPVTLRPGALTVPGGREYLIDVQLYGLESGRWGAPMPPMRHLKDVEIAATLNYIVSRFSAESPDSTLLYAPTDIAERRTSRSTPADVNRRRPFEGEAQSPR